MKQLRLIAAALAASFAAGPAFAADLPARKEAPVYVAPTSVFSWTGFYGGANIGWAGMSLKNDYYTPGGGFPFWLPGDAAPISAGGGNSFSEGGVAFGGQAGYNYQMGMFVAGLEADFDWLSLSGHSTVVASGATPGVVALYNTNARVDWMMTVRPRLGLALGQFLPYITGGLALVHSSFGQTVLFPPGGAAAVSDGGLAYSSTDSTWTLGGGMEYALSPNWSIKAEYLHVFMPDKTLTSWGHSPYFGASSLIAYTRTLSQSIDTVRLGVNYRFN
jgi:outer membrane immunogenic protein